MDVGPKKRITKLIFINESSMQAYLTYRWLGDKTLCLKIKQISGA